MNKLKWTGWFILSSLALLAVGAIICVLVLIVQMIKYLIAFLIAAAFIAYCLKRGYDGQKKSNK